MQRLLVFGAGGHGREIAWLAEECHGREIEIIHVVDLPTYIQGDVNGRPVRLLADCSRFPGAHYVVAVGDSHLRQRAAAQCEDVGLVATSLIHPRAEVSRWVSWGEGSVVCAGTVLTTNVSLGRHVHVNVGCTISHDVVIGDFSTLAPGVHIAGHVHLGQHVVVGIGASIINGNAEQPLHVGDGAVIAAGACVARPVTAGSMVAGVPATQKH